MKWLNFGINLMFISGLLFVALQRVPSTMQHLQREGTQLPTFQTQSLTGQIVNSKILPRPLVLVFWATWCPPCEIELGRINKMIINQKLSANSVLAITGHENIDTVKKTSVERGYVFPIAVDDREKLFDQFNIRGTPTSILVDFENNMKWITTGISPLLEFRLQNLHSHPTPETH